MSSVDVIVPCYRYGHFLKQCVESVLAQSGPSVRVLIIDDASPDNTGEVATSLAAGDARVAVSRHSTNLGHLATYNEGIEWASADYMLILSADDYLLPGALERAAKLMDEYPKVGLTFGNAIRLDAQGSTTSATKRPTTGGEFNIFTGSEFVELCGASNVVPSPCAVVRTELQKRIGGYRPDLPHTGDIEMWLRFAAHAPVGEITACQAVYRRHVGNMSLAYMADGGLADLIHIKAAYVHFFKTFGPGLVRAQKLERRFYWLLACDAIGSAGEVLGRGQIEICDRLSEFALEVCPRFKKSLRWLKFCIKRATAPKPSVSLAARASAATTIARKD
jgi:glycosyltransferase involved in cell wall biosynthesis